MRAEERLDSICETCGRRGLTLPTSHELDRVPDTVVLGSEVRWVLLLERSLWVALPRRMTTHDACEALQRETGMVWHRRCSICILSDPESGAESEEGSSLLFGSGRAVALEQFGVYTERAGTIAQLDAAILRQIDRFDRQAYEGARHAKRLREFLGMLAEKEDRHTLSLLLAAASWEMKSEAAGVRRRPSRVIQKRGRHVSRPIFNELLRFVTMTYRKADGDSPRRNLWKHAADVVRPYLFLDRHWERRRMTDEAARQVVKRVRAG